MLQTGLKAALYGAFITLAFQYLPDCAMARDHHHLRLAGRSEYHHAKIYGARVIQCVAFAKQDAGIDLSGNARDWWSNAEGLYSRGKRPEPGSVLSFMANGRMPLGHVAVVSSVEDSRTIIIDQSHWNSRGITRDIEVKDVSEDNDWSAVRVQLSHTTDFGSIYPTHGFIYPRPDSGAIVETDTRTPAPALGPAPADLRSAARHHPVASIEVAEAPAVGRGLDLSLPGISSDAPDRAFK